MNQRPLVSVTMVRAKTVVPVWTRGYTVIQVTSVSARLPLVGHGVRVQVKGINIIPITIMTIIMIMKLIKITIMIIDNVNDNNGDKITIIIITLALLPIYNYFNFAAYKVNNTMV